MIPRNILQKAVLLSALYLLTACNQASSAPVVGEITPQPSTTITTGEKASLTIPVSGSELKFEWSASRGTLLNSTQPAVIYTAPDSAGPDTVTVKVTYSGGEIIKNINFDVVEPPPPAATDTPVPTDTPIPTNTPTPTPIPEPIVCNSPAVTKDVFPQLEDVNGQFPFHGLVDDPRFDCQAVFDIFHNEPMAVRIEYQNVEKNFGWWGIGVPTDSPFSVSKYSEICFWAYAQKPKQSFRLKMKDTSSPPKEDGPTIILEEANKWTQVCTDLTKFSDLGIQLDSLENINLGFEQPTGSAEIWVDDFEFKE